jgi:ATP-dependent Zn protease
MENTKKRKSKLELDAKKNMALVKYEEELGDKSKVQLREDFTTLTVLAFMTHNTEQYMIVAQKRASLFWSCLMSQIFVTLMLVCISYAILVNEN